LEGSGKGPLPRPKRGETVNTYTTYGIKLVCEARAAQPLKTELTVPRVGGSLALDLIGNLDVVWDTIERSVDLEVLIAHKRRAHLADALHDAARFGEVVDFERLLARLKEDMRDAWPVDSKGHDPLATDAVWAALNSL
jgi:RNAse (barnase) inhibitor barstar